MAAPQFNRPLFRMALRRATRNAEITGKITAEEAETVYGVLEKPIRKIGKQKINILDELENDLTPELVGAVDWAKLLQWLKDNLATIIQMIISILAIFAGSDE